MDYYASYSATRHGGRIKITRQHPELGEVPITVEDAAAAWRDGKVTDCNLTFQRLAQNDFDIGETCRFYREAAAAERRAAKSA